MPKEEYDQLIREQFIGRIAFKGDGSTYIAPFMYVFDGKRMYFLSTRYGKKVEYFSKSPDVSVEVEQYAPDMSSYRFVTLTGRLEEVKGSADARQIRGKFLDMFKARKLSHNALAALGHSPQEPFEVIMSDSTTAVWKLTDVEQIVGLKNAGAK
jgi:nitroimidazol reductase NimA-like FMN-containing flavoprotein (pyridoxamine 5'-phosphate oxidase superfamily)